MAPSLAASQYLSSSSNSSFFSVFVARRRPCPVRVVALPWYLKGSGAGDDGTDDAAEKNGSLEDNDNIDIMEDVDIAGDRVGVDLVGVDLDDVDLVGVDGVVRLFAEAALRWLVTSSTKTPRVIGFVPTMSL